jgi:hypothetical protein
MPESTLSEKASCCVWIVAPVVFLILPQIGCLLLVCPKRTPAKAKIGVST